MLQFLEVEICLVTKMFLKKQKVDLKNISTMELIHVIARKTFQQLI